MRQITRVRKAVCGMANRLKRAGYSLSEAFRMAWKRIKLSMTVRAAGVTYENRQERLAFLKRFGADDLRVTLERERGNGYDGNAIQIVVHILPIRRRTVIGYVPGKVAGELCGILDVGIQAKASLKGIIGGYGYKESLGALINISV